MTYRSGAFLFYHTHSPHVPILPTSGWSPLDGLLSLPGMVTVGPFNN